MEDRERDRWGNGVTRREFEAVVNPIRRDIESINRVTDNIQAMVATAIGQWHQTNARFTEDVNRLDRKIIFAQGFTAAVAFLVGSGALVGALYFILAQ